ncbi:hypothetical protein C2E23DRAFT_714476, partial [Lenzites betulinus]
VPTYLEDEHGDVFSRGAYDELRQLLKRLFHTLLSHSLAPATWGSRNTHATRYIQAETYKVFPVLAKCQAHYRLHTLITRMYPDFVRHYLKPATGGVKNEENSDSEPRTKHTMSSKVSLPPAKKSKHARKY